MVYLLHYDAPLHHAQHYVGYCDDPVRIEKHGNGTSGAHLPAAFHRAGTQFVVARTWDGDRALERRLKTRHNARMLCPICQPAKRQQHAANVRAYRARKKAPVPA